MIVRAARAVGFKREVFLQTPPSNCRRQRVCQLTLRRPASLPPSRPIRRLLGYASSFPRDPLSCTDHEHSPPPSHIDSPSSLWCRSLCKPCLRRPSLSNASLTHSQPSLQSQVPRAKLLAVVAFALSSSSVAQIQTHLHLPQPRPEAKTPFFPSFPLSPIYLPHSLPPERSFPLVSFSLPPLSALSRHSLLVPSPASASVSLALSLPPLPAPPVCLSLDGSMLNFGNWLSCMVVE